jgi:hypothetical protein
MGKFYAIYKVVNLTFGDCHERTYEIYEKEVDFLISLYKFIEDLKLSYCNIDDKEDDEETISRLLAECKYDEEEYDTYTSLIAKKIQTSSIDNGLYDRIFNCFDIVFGIDIATEDYKEFIDVMYDSLREETGPLDTDDELEKDEILAENQMLKYLIAIMETEAYPTEEDFSRQFNMLENDVNKNAGCLIGYYGRYRFA